MKFHNLINLVPISIIISNYLFLLSKFFFSLHHIRLVFCLYFYHKYSHFLPNSSVITSLQDNNIPHCTQSEICPFDESYHHGFVCFHLCSVSQSINYMYNSTTHIAKLTWSNAMMINGIVGIIAEY